MLAWLYFGARLFVLAAEVAATLDAEQGARPSP